MDITFYGGARIVTGANYLIQANGKKILVDCGLFQGDRFNEEMNYQAFAYDPASIDAVLITHSHTDHIGRLPKLYKDGFRGQVFTTEPTQGIMELSLPDTLDKIKAEAKAEGHPPLFGDNDIKELMSLVRGVKYLQPVALGEGITAIFHEASHILGSAIIELTVKEDGAEKRIVFTGDLGNAPTILLNPIDYVHGADYAVIESAYGDRIHEDRAKRRELLLDAIRETVKRGGALMIPSFAIERTQELLLELDVLFEKGELPKVPFFVDSPLAINMTRVYGQFSNYFKPEAVQILRDNKGLFNFPWLTFAPTTEDSKRINDVPAPKIIIAGSGMSQGGRIVHHEARYLPDPKSMILFIGYQVNGSLGRRILDGHSPVTVLGQKVPVACQVRSIGAYSAHADQNGLVRFISEAAKGGNLKQVFVVQGEENAAQALAQRITAETNVPASVPAIGQTSPLS